MQYSYGSKFKIKDFPEAIGHPSDSRDLKFLLLQWYTCARKSKHRFYVLTTFEVSHAAIG